MKRQLLTIAITSALLGTSAFASTDMLDTTEIQTDESLQMPKTIDELWQMYLELLEKYEKLQADYENLLSKNDMKTDEEKPEVSEYKSGTYKVGGTIPAGEYIIYPFDDSVYYSVSSDANGDDIIFNGYTYGNAFATIYEGEYFTIQKGYAVPYTGEEPILNVDNTFMAKVGDQIEPGEYLATATDDYGFYSIYTDSRFEDIVTNDYFAGTAYFYIEEGQYLEINGCELIKQ